MSAHVPTQDGPADSVRQPAERDAGRDGTAQPLRILGLAAVCVGVAALAAATFVLSYTGIRVVAQQAGITPHYARAYPLLIDAMLVIALSAVLALRGAGLPSRALAWLTLLVVLAAAAGADALHATGHALARNAAAVTAAVLPWALVLVAFMLLLALLRYLRLRRQAVTAGRWRAPGPVGRPDADLRTAGAPTLPLPKRTPQRRNSSTIVPGLTPQPTPSAAAGAASAADASLAAAADGPVSAPTDAGSRQSEAADGPETLTPQPGSGAPDPAGAAADPGPADPGPAADQAADDQEDSDDMPVFHRMWSSPTPPGS
ncbi:MAG TPA: DUF2637 domain-containing protein [Streptosporangiaceae bacterium]|nr:DUF2637 domain-containing protein [Streptosporangiaceae bacterium]